MSTGDSILLVIVGAILSLAFFHQLFPALLRPWRLYRQYRFVALAILVLTSLTVGYVGFAPSPTKDGSALVIDEPGRATNALRMVKLLGSESTIEPLGTIGRAASVVAWIMLGLELQLVLMYSLLQSGRSWSIGNHTVICGLGSIGSQLIDDLLAQRAWIGKLEVAVIERDKNNPYLEKVREAGGWVIIGDATDPDVIERVKLHRAKELFAVAGSDGRNAAIISNAGTSVSRHGRGTRDPLQCYAHIDNRQLAAAAGRFDTNNRYRDIEVDFVSPADRAAIGLSLIHI